MKYDLVQYHFTVTGLDVPVPYIRAINALNFQSAMIDLLCNYPYQWDLIDKIELAPIRDKDGNKVPV